MSNFITLAFTRAQILQMQKYPTFLGFYGKQIVVNGVSVPLQNSKAYFRYDLCEIPERFNVRKERYAVLKIYTRPWAREQQKTNM